MAEKIGIKSYLAAALFANSTRILFTFISYPFLSNISVISLFLIIWLITILSGIVPAFFLTQKKREKHMLSGAIAGLYSYIDYVILSFFGFKSQIDETWVLLGFLLGGLLGGRFGEKGKRSDFHSYLENISKKITGAHAALSILC